MSLCKPVIATNWSGSTEFMNADNSFLINVDRLVPIPSGPFANHLWAEPSVTHLSHLMRFVFENREEASRIGERACADVREKYSEETLGNQVMQEFYRIGKLFDKDL